MIDVSIIIVTWNSEKYIHRCLQSLWRQARGCSFEIIVVDNGSTDNTVPAIRMHFPDVRLFEQGANIGFPRATNIGLRESRGEYFFLLNPDTELQAEVLDRLVDFLKGHPEAGCVSPKVIETDGSVAMFHVREFPDLSNVFFRHFGLRMIFPRNRLFGKETFGDWNYASTRSVPCLHGAALMMPRSTIAVIGELDEQLPMYFEDLDLCARIGKAGKLLYYEPAAVVVHHGGKSSALSPMQGLLHAMKDGQAPWLFMRKYSGSFASAVFVAIVLLGSSLRIPVLALLARLSRALRVGDPGEIESRLNRSKIMLDWALSDKEEFMSAVGRKFQ